MDYTYVVICRDDRRSEDAPPGDYILATREVFGSQSAADAYARTVNANREPLVVEGRWHQLRHGFDERDEQWQRIKRASAVLEQIDEQLKVLIAHYETRDSK